MELFMMSSIISFIFCLRSLGQQQTATANQLKIDWLKKAQNSIAVRHWSNPKSFSKLFHNQLGRIIDLLPWKKRTEPTQKNETNNTVVVEAMKKYSGVAFARTFTSSLLLIHTHRPTFARIKMKQPFCVVQQWDACRNTIYLWISFHAVHKRRRRRCSAYFIVSNYSQSNRKSNWRQRCRSKIGKMASFFSALTQSTRGNNILLHFIFSFS